MKSWTSSTDELKFTDIPSRPCQRNDFIGSSEMEGETSAYGFHPMDEATRTIVLESSYHLRCIEDQYEIKGDFNSNAASNLMVTFEICDP